MRNPNRIHQFCVILEMLWKAFPDMRFGQIVQNFIMSNHGTLFYQEDETSLDNLAHSYLRYVLKDRENINDYIK